MRQKKTRRPVITTALVNLASHPKCVAIGEAGLDYFYDYAPRQAQADSFRTQIRAARDLGLPIIVHARDADEDMADILESEMKKGAFKGVLHCFSSGARLAERALAIGFYISFSGILTFNKSEELRQIAKNVRWTGFWWKQIRPIWHRRPIAAKPMSRALPAMC